jgi:threonine aldolase
MNDHTHPRPGAVDLRSDTVTRPTPGMRRAIAEAEVGDDVFGDDPTVHELERRVAGLAGKEAALFVPSGTMGNQLAIRVQTARGDEVMVEADSHIVLYEQGGMSANSGCTPRVVRGERGALAPQMVDDAISEDDEHVARLTLVCMENTHNVAGGAIVPLERLRAVSNAARAHGLAVHLDGARLWNASVATGVPIADWAATSDSVMMCFSKGLGAPIGSILTGPETLITAARRVRKLWGGGMRQVGILAAACLYALDHHVARLADDHRRARTLAAGIGDLPGVSVPTPDTNLVYIHLEEGAIPAAALLAGLEARNVRMAQYGPRLLRAAVHLDVDDQGIARAIEAFLEVAARAGAAS